MCLSCFGKTKVLEEESTWPTTYFNHSIPILLLEEGSSAGLKILYVNVCLLTK